MLKQELKSHFLLTILWLIVITILRYRLSAPFLYQLPDIFYLWIGGFLGTMIIDLDQFIYVLFSHPEEYNSQRIKRSLVLKNWKEALALIAETSGERTKLVFHNILFHAVLIILAFFIISSTQSIFGKGLVMAMFIHLLKDEFELYKKGNHDFLIRLLFWPVRVNITLNVLKYFLYLNFATFLIFSLLLA